MDNLTDRVGIRADTKQQLLMLLGAHDVSRFHTVATIGRNTVAAHSWGVAWLCYLLSTESPGVMLLMAALSHDLAEQVTGDIPAPAKRMYGIRDTITNWEHCILADNHAAVFHSTLTEEERNVLKLADNMDGMLCCIHERRLGNRNVEAVYRRFRTYIITEQKLTLNGCALFKAIEELWEEACGKQKSISAVAE